ncbi:hypothetical protein J4Q44_G00059320 [Coregonus suidteri]|uniref:UPAR/Ly6 domain-containing protein n=1 Tax=Coregonus suidteri TaxID=861788 RepID=A0AAN8M2M3_9TELE
MCGSGGTLCCGRVPEFATHVLWGLAAFVLLVQAKHVAPPEPNCYTGQAVFNISSILSIKSKGCLATASCNTTSTGSILTAGYTVSQTCCSTNLCNGAGAIQLLSLIVAIGAALVAIWEHCHLNKPFTIRRPPPRFPLKGVVGCSS